MVDVSKILIIDDSEGDRFLIERFLKKIRADIKVLQAENIAAGVEMIQNNPDIDFAFLDYRLPDKNGIQFLKSLYNPKTRLCPFPVVVMTGQGNEGVAIDAIKYGAQDYLVKSTISSQTLKISLVKATEFYALKQDNDKKNAIILQSQKVEALGHLTGGIAHDFNNLLTITLGNTGLLRSLLSQEPVNTDECLKKLIKIEETTKRGIKLIKHLMMFSHQKSLQPEAFNLNQLITDIGDLLGRTLGEFIQIETTYEEALSHIFVDRIQLENAVINMCVNARDAMIDGGTLSIKTRNAVIEEEGARKVGMQPGPYVQLTIEDTGSGIPEEAIEKIFNPFFTTKAIGSGTGLGLSMVHGFVQSSGGYITVQSTPGQGTCFDLFFPAREAAVPEEKIPKKRNSSLSEYDGTETILVVEDEPEIRSLAVTMLKERGYLVLEAQNGEDALNKIKAYKGHIDLMFTDIAMPGEFNGVQAAARAQVLRPDIKLLFTSGYASSSLPDLRLAEKYPFIMKPYVPEDMLRILRDILDKGGNKMGQALTSKPSVLIVDDQEALREMLEEFLQQNGFDAFVAKDGYKALKALEEKKYDLVITDIFMPEKEGISTIMDIKNKHPETKIIAMTGGGVIMLEDALRTAKGLGADATIEKPFEMQDLLHLSCQILDGEKPEENRVKG